MLCVTSKVCVIWALKVECSGDRHWSKLGISKVDPNWDLDINVETHISPMLLDGFQKFFRIQQYISIEVYLSKIWANLRSLPAWQKKGKWISKVVIFSTLCINLHKFFNSTDMKLKHWVHWVVWEIEYQRYVQHQLWRLSIRAAGATGIGWSWLFPRLSQNNFLTSMLKLIYLLWYLMDFKNYFRNISQLKYICFKYVWIAAVCILGKKSKIDIKTCHFWHSFINLYHTFLFLVMYACWLDIFLK